MGSIGYCGLIWEPDHHLNVVPIGNRVPSLNKRITNQFLRRNPFVNLERSVLVYDIDIFNFNQ